LIPHEWTLTRALLVDPAARGAHYADRAPREWAAEYARIRPGRRDADANPERERHELHVASELAEEIGGDVTVDDVVAVHAVVCANAFALEAMCTRLNYGAGFFAAAAYMNHSCDPNCLSLRLGGNMAVFAARDVHPGGGAHALVPPVASAAASATRAAVASILRLPVRALSEARAGFEEEERPNRVDPGVRRDEGAARVGARRGVPGEPNRARERGVRPENRRRRRDAVGRSAGVQGGHLRRRAEGRRRVVRQRRDAAGPLPAGVARAVGARDRRALARGARLRERLGEAAADTAPVRRRSKDAVQAAVLGRASPRRAAAGRAARGERGESVERFHRGTARASRGGGRRRPRGVGASARRRGGFLVCHGGCGGGQWRERNRRAQGVTVPCRRARGLARVRAGGHAVPSRDAGAVRGGRRRSSAS
jgi:hypothetical protein